jgi:septal ring factor EnvC (AmiA/AmiB activator)
MALPGAYIPGLKPRDKKRINSKSLIMLKIVFTCLLVACSWGLFAQSSDELKRKQAEIQREIEDLRKTLNDTKKNKKAGLGQLAMVQKKLRLREQAIGNINQQINVIQGTISQSRNEITRLKTELDTLKLLYEKSVVYAYKNRNNYDFLNFIFSAASFNDALKRIEYLKSYRNYREEQAENIKKTQGFLQQKITGLEVTRIQKDEVLKRQQKEKQVLVEEKKEKDEIVSKLKAREKEISKELVAKQKADQKLRSAIKVAIDREIRIAREKAMADEKAKLAAAPKPTAPTTTTTPRREEKKSTSVFESTPEGVLISGNFERNRGKLPWPIDKGNIKIRFGTYAIEGTKLRGNNPGLTLETVPGAVVKAVYEGEVSRIFDIEGNWTVLVRHGKYFTVYSNLSGVSVAKDQKVSAGQMLGRAAANNDGNGEIEFLLMMENRNLDPESWISRR